MKMNKKGFTLIEMLVVIAIIAILVAIVIPVVGSSTAKAQAATDAANLRSAQAALQIAVLNGTAPKGTESTDVAGTKDTYPVHISGTGATSPTAPVCKTDKDWTFKYTIDALGNVEVFFNDGTNDLGINSFAEKAGS